MKQFDENILEVKDLETYFFTEEGTSKAVNKISFSLKKGETLGIVGESGSGKSITSLSLLRLIPSPPGKIVGGSINFKGEDLLSKTEKQMRSIRGNEISMIFQEPMTSLNPVYSVGEQIAEVIRLHQKLGKKEAWQKAVDMLKLVGIPSPEKRAKQEPHELSGGMRQRVMIAMALACHPEVLIADEPTTALDVTIQAQILELIKNLQKDFGTAVILITHDLGVVYESCDRVAVMYAGKIVEYTTATELFSNPKHPYTIGLLNSLPRLDMDQEELTTIPGTVPSPYNMPKGCSFAPRCAHAKKLCEELVPDLQLIDEHTQVSCWKHTARWDREFITHEKVGVE